MYVLQRTAYGRIVERCKQALGALRQLGRIAAQNLDKQQLHQAAEHQFAAGGSSVGGVRDRLP